MRIRRSPLRERFLTLREQIVSEYQSGTTAPDLARKYGFSRHTLTGYFRQFRILAQSIVGMKGRARADLMERGAQIAQQYQAGWSFRKLSAEYQTTYGPIRRVLTRLGIRLRSQSEGCVTRYLDPAEREKITQRNRHALQDPEIMQRRIEGCRRRSADPQYLQKLSQSLKGKYTGPHASNWQGGVSFLAYPHTFNKAFKEKIRDRDGFRCRLCTVTEEESLRFWHRVLCVHHIDYDKTNCDESNLLTLCFICNIKVNTDREFWKGMLTMHEQPEFDLLKEHGYYVDPQSGMLHLRLPAPHPQVLPFFPQYTPRIKPPTTIIDYRDPRNAVGHQQRAWLVAYCLQAMEESGGGVGLDLGSGGVQMPGCLSVDIIGNNETPTYGGVMSGVHVKADAADLSVFQDGAFSIVIGNHIVEHLPCSRLPATASAAHRFKYACPGDEVAEILRAHWLRVLRPGGLLCCILPDEQYATAVSSSTLYYDSDHKHAFSAASFRRWVLARLTDLCEVIEFDTFGNNFSLNVCLRKR